MIVGRFCVVTNDISAPGLISADSSPGAALIRNDLYALLSKPFGIGFTVFVSRGMINLIVNPPA